MKPIRRLIVRVLWKLVQFFCPHDDIDICTVDNHPKYDSQAPVYDCRNCGKILGYVHY